jgi:hypothetical protein
MPFESRSTSLGGVGVRTRLLLSIAVLAGACTTPPSLTPQERQELETRILDGEMEALFFSSRSVLQNHGFTIGHSELASGTLTGESVEERNGTKKKASVTLEKWAPQKTRIRITLLDLKKISRGGGYISSGSGRGHTGGFIFLPGQTEWVETRNSDPQTYQLLFDEIKREMFRRESQKTN